MKVVDQKLPIKTQVYTIIKESIMKFELLPGERLSEKDISIKLNVSRTPVREAFITLSQEGLVEVLPQRGTFVSLIDKQKVYASSFIRKALEVEVIKEVIKKCDNKDIDRLRHVVDLQLEREKEDDFLGFFELDEHFHQTLTEISGYPRVWEVIKIENVEMDRMRYLSLSMDYQVMNVIKEHISIIDAVGLKDEMKAKEVVKRHGMKPEVVEILSEKFPNYFVV